MGRVAIFDLGEVNKRVYNESELRKAILQSILVPGGSRKVFGRKTPSGNTSLPPHSAGDVTVGHLRTSRPANATYLVAHLQFMLKFAMPKSY